MVCLGLFVFDGMQNSHPCNSLSRSLTKCQNVSFLETVTVAIKPKPPAKHIQDCFDDDDGEDLVSFM